MLLVFLEILSIKVWKRKHATIERDPSLRRDSVECTGAPRKKRHREYSILPAQCLKNILSSAKSRQHDSRLEICSMYFGVPICGIISVGRSMLASRCKTAVTYCTVPTPCSSVPSNPTPGRHMLLRSMKWIHQLTVVAHKKLIFMYFLSVHLHDKVSRQFVLLLEKHLHHRNVSTFLSTFLPVHLTSCAKKATRR